MGLKAKFTQGAAPRGDDGRPPGAEAVSAVDEAAALDGVPEQLAELARRKLVHRFGVRRELKALPTVLAEGEEVVNLAAGAYDGRRGLLVVTDRRLVFFEKGMARSRQEDFPYSKISSIQTETSMMQGRMIVFVTGNKAVMNQVMPKERVGEIGEYVRGRIAAGDVPKGPSAEPEASAPDAGPEDRLHRLRDMLASGLISPDEYEAKRQQILETL